MISIIPAARKPSTWTYYNTQYNVYEKKIRLRETHHEGAYLYNIIYCRVYKIYHIYNIRKKVF